MYHVLISLNIPEIVNNTSLVTRIIQSRVKTPVLYKWFYFG